MVPKAIAGTVTGPFAGPIATVAKTGPRRLAGGLRALGRRRWLGFGLAVLLGLGPLLLVHSPQQSLSAAEATVAQQAWDMLSHNDWITLAWWGTPQFDRPPGLQWLIALSYHWFGRSELAARLPSMAAGVGAIALTGCLGRRLGPPHTGLWAAAILAVLPLGMQASRLASPGMTLVALTLLAIWALLRSEDCSGDRPEPRKLWGMAAGLALGLGGLVAGAMVMLPILALLPYMVQGMVRGHRRHLTNIGLYYGLALGALPTALWLTHAIARYGPAPVAQLRAAAASHLGLWGLGHGDVPGALQTASPWQYHLWHLPLTTFPWVGFALVGVWLVGRQEQRRTLWLGYPAVLLGLMGLLEDTGGVQTLLLYPFVALLAAVGLQHLGRLFRSRAPRRHRIALGLSWGVGVLGLVGLSAGAAMLVTPGELIAADLRPLGWLGVAGGLGLLLPWLVAINRWQRVPHRQQQLWQGAWLLGPWLLAIAAFGTGLFGNYSGALKQSLQTPPIASVLAQYPVHLVQPGGNPDSALFTFYTPQPGKPLGHWSQIPAEGYAWGNASLVPLDSDRYREVATVGEWVLVQAPVLPTAMPRG